MILLNYFIYILLYIIIYMSSNIFQINNNFDILPIQPNFNDKSKENMLKIYDFAPFLFLNKNDKLPKEFNNMNSLVNQYDDEKFQLYDFKLLEKQFFSNESLKQNLKTTVHGDSIRIHSSQFTCAIKKQLQI